MGRRHGQVVSVDCWEINMDLTRAVGISVFCEASAFHKMMICKESLGGSNPGNVTANLAARAFRSGWVTP